MRTCFSLRVTSRTIHPVHMHWLKMLERFCVSLRNHPIRAPCHSWVFLSFLLSLLSCLRLRRLRLTGIRVKPVRDSPLAWARLAIWPTRLQTQVISPSSASTSAARIRRSTFRPETAASTWRMTRQIAASEDFELASSSRHSVARIVPTLLKLGSPGSGTRKLAADADHETVVSVEESLLTENRDPDLNVTQTLKDGQNLHKFLERTAELACRGEISAQKRLSEAEAEM